MSSNFVSLSTAFWNLHDRALNLSLSFRRSAHTSQSEHVQKSRTHSEFGVGTSGGVTFVLPSFRDSSSRERVLFLRNARVYFLVFSGMVPDFVKRSITFAPKSLSSRLTTRFLVYAFAILSHQAEVYTRISDFQSNQMGGGTSGTQNGCGTGKGGRGRLLCSTGQALFNTVNTC